MSLTTSYLNVKKLDEKYYFANVSHETESFFLPFALLAANTLRPLAVDIR